MRHEYVTYNQSSDDVDDFDDSYIVLTLNIIKINYTHNFTYRHRHKIIFLIL